MIYLYQFRFGRWHMKSHITVAVTWLSILYTCSLSETACKICYNNSCIRFRKIKVAFLFIVSDLRNPDCLGFYVSWNKYWKNDQSVLFIIHPLSLCDGPLFVFKPRLHVLTLLYNICWSNNVRTCSQHVR